jgi:hypothetical protein
VITGVGSGTFLLAYANNPGTGNQTFLQTLNYQQLLIAPSALTTSQRSGTTTGAALTIPAGTVGETDQATVSGANATSASGTVAYALYSSPTCTPSSLVFNGGTGTVTGVLAAPSAAVTTALAPGTYYWLAVYGGNATNAASASTCGSEILTVGPGTTLGGTASGTSTAVTVTITCATLPCTVTVTITIGGGPAADVAGVAKAKTVTLGKGTFTLRKSKTSKLTVKLSKQGKSYFKSHHGTLKATLGLSEKFGTKTVLSTKTIRIKRK